MQPGEKMVTVPESLVNEASNAIESAQIYLAALRAISNAVVRDKQALALQAIAREALGLSFDYNDLNQVILEDPKINDR